MIHDNYQKKRALVEMSTFAERARLRAAERAAAAAAAPVKRGVRFIGNATGGLNVAPSPTRKASPRHRNRGATRRALRPAAHVSPADSPPLRPGRGALKFRRAVEHHERATTRGSKKRSTRKKGRKGKRKGTRHHR